MSTNQMVYILQDFLLDDLQNGVGSTRVLVFREGTFEQRSVGCQTWLFVTLWLHVPIRKLFIDKLMVVIELLNSIEMIDFGFD